MQFAATYPLKEIRRIQIYHNTRSYTERELDKILDGDLQEILDALMAADQAAKLANMNEAEY